MSEMKFTFVAPVKTYRLYNLFKLKLLDIIKMNSDRFDISTEASKTLRHFCEYQRNFGQYVKKRKGSLVYKITINDFELQKKIFLNLK